MIGWLRRARALALLVLAAGILLYILSSNLPQTPRMDWLQKGMMGMLAPVFKGVSQVGGVVDEWIRHYVFLTQVERENERLRRQVAQLQERLTGFREAALQNRRLRRLLDLKARVKGRCVAAQVVVRDPSGWFQTAVIDKGSKDGVLVDMPVLDDLGVVGRVMEVTDHYARVLLITDPESAVDALIQSNRVRGVLCGRDEQRCLLRYVQRNQEVRTGDLVVTSGKDGIFPPGLRLGIVRQVVKDPVNLFQNVVVEPVAKPHDIEEVLLLAPDATIPERWNHKENRVGVR